MDGFDETYRNTKVKKKNESKSKQPDWLVRLCTAQLVLAALGIGLLLLAAKASPVVYAEMRNTFNSVMNEDMSVKEIAAVVKGYLYPSGGEDTPLYQATETVCFAPLSTTVQLKWPVEGRITSKFGYRYHPITGKLAIHNGTDIAAAIGTPVASAFNGKVEEVGYTAARGNYVLLSHGGETQTLYMHLSEVIAPEGAVVRQGETIAKVGNTGRSTGPHLHFSVIVGGKYCNPEWLKNDV